MNTYNLPPSVKRQLDSVNQGEITIVVGSDASENLQASIVHSDALARSGQFDSVFYLNIPFSRRRFTEAGGATMNKQVACYHVANGQLVYTAKGLKNSMRNPERTAIVINSWELPSSCYRYREELIFALLELTVESGVSVFVYCCAKPESVTAGKINRTGLGKLAAAADAVISLKAPQLNVEEIEETEEEIVGENVIRLPKPEQKMREVVNLEGSNFNNLATSDGHPSGNVDLGKIIEEWAAKQSSRRLVEAG